MCYWRFIQIVFIDKLFYLCFSHLIFDPVVRILGFPSGSVIKNPPANAGESREEFNPWVRKILWTRKGQHTPVFLPGKFHDRAAWQAAVHGITKSYIWLSEHTHIFNVKQSKANTKINTLKTVWDCVCVGMHAHVCVHVYFCFHAMGAGRRERPIHLDSFLPLLPANSCLFLLLPFDF